MRLLNVKQVAEILNAKPSTIYQWAESGLVPCFKLNGLLRFSEDDIIAWIKSCKNRPQEGYNILTGGRLRKGG